MPDSSPEIFNCLFWAFVLSLALWTCMLPSKTVMVLIIVPLMQYHLTGLSSEPGTLRYTSRALCLIGGCSRDDSFVHAWCGRIFSFHITPRRQVWGAHTLAMPNAVLNKRYAVHRCISNRMTVNVWRITLPALCGVRRLCRRVLRRGGAALGSQQVSRAVGRGV